MWHESRCRREIAAIEAQLRAGHPDLQGLCLALMDWSAELRILLGQPLDPQRETPPGLKPAAFVKEHNGVQTPME